MIQFDFQEQFICPLWDAVNRVDENVIEDRDILMDHAIKIVEGRL